MRAAGTTVDLYYPAAPGSDAMNLDQERRALEYVEACGDDLKVPFGLPFPKMAKAKTGETVFFSFIVYKSRAHRDAVNKKVMADKRLQAMCDPKKTPFDVKRMAYGGFKALVEI